MPSPIIHVHKVKYPHTDVLLLLIPASVFVLVLSLLIMFFGTPTMPATLRDSITNALQ